jgi:hypothetical protein
MGQAQKWIGSAQYLFIPLNVRNVDGYSPPPTNFREYVQRRLYYDPDPISGYDRSLCSYIADVSYGRASLNARVSEPVTVDGLPSSMTLAAIEAQVNSHLYQYLAVIFPSNTRGAGTGMAQSGRIDFVPPRSPNRTRARSRFLWTESTGTWAMEIIHNVTAIGDYYNGVNGPEYYDEMDKAAATHPSVYTKLEAGWIDQRSVPWHVGPGDDKFALHAVALPQPPNEGRVAGVRIKAPGSNRYLIVEARLKSDRWDRGFAAARVPPELTSRDYQGINAEGVIVYEFSPETDSWPRANPTGPWPPLQLRAELSVGDTFTHFDSSTLNPGGASFETGVGRRRTITVQSAIVGGFVIQITTDQRPDRPGRGGDNASPGTQPP